MPPKKKIVRDQSIFAAGICFVLISRIFCYNRRIMTHSANDRYKQAVETICAMCDASRATVMSIQMHRPNRATIEIVLPQKETDEQSGDESIDETSGE